MEDKIKEAIKLLQENDYIVYKLSARQIKDCDECEKMAETGKDKECFECSCSCCIVQG